MSVCLPPSVPSLALSPSPPWRRWAIFGAGFRESHGQASAVSLCSSLSRPTQRRASVHACHRSIRHPHAVPRDHTRRGFPGRCRVCLVRHASVPSAFWRRRRRCDGPHSRRRRGDRGHRFALGDSLDRRRDLDRLVARGASGRVRHRRVDPAGVVLRPQASTLVGDRDGTRGRHADGAAKANAARDTIAQSTTDDVAAGGLSDQASAAAAVAWHEQPPVGQAAASRLGGGRHRRRHADVGIQPGQTSTTSRPTGPTPTRCCSSSIQAQAAGLPVASEKGARSPPTNNGSGGSSEATLSQEAQAVTSPGAQAGEGDLRRECELLHRRPDAASSAASCCCGISF